MRKLIICDKNRKLITAVKKMLKEHGNGVFDEVEVVCGDVIEIHEKTPNSRIVTASNPSFSPDGGLDKVLAEKYGWGSASEFNYNDHLFYIKSVDDERKSSKAILLRAAVGILAYSTKFVPILTGIGTGIGGIATEVFLEIVKAIISNLQEANLRGANLGRANLGGANLRGANLREANLQEANLQEANLRGANLRGANLRGANLQEANLGRADLWEANLWEANLGRADLRGADLGGADLWGADLWGANLGRADLRGANLRGANLRGADLRGADLRGADLWEANLGRADLWGAKNIPSKFHDSLNILRYQKGKLRAFKYVTESLRSPQKNGAIEYKVGKIVTEKEFSKDDRVLCDMGLNVASLEWCVREGNTDTFIEVEFDVDKICSIPYNTDGKFRVTELRVIRKFNRREAEKMLKDHSNLT